MSTARALHVVMMSGGIGSWATARIVVNRYGPDSTVLLFADTQAEHPDLYRFLHDAARDLGVPITRVADGRTPWKVFRDVRRIGNSQIAPCSHLLKQKPCRDWLEANTTPGTATVYVGIDWSETHRLPAIVSKWQPWPVQAPLCEPPYRDKDALIAEAEAAGIQTPELYKLGFPHNNCGGACVRAGQAQWALLLHTDPERFAAEEAEENTTREYLGKDVAVLRDRRGGTTTPLPLTVLRSRIETSNAQHPSFDSDDWGGCGCFTDTVPGDTVDTTTPLLRLVPDTTTNYEENEVNEVTKQVTGTPSLHTAALHGPVGDAVRRIHPTTEAHPAGVLVQILALLGGMVGDGPHVVIGGSAHPARIWPLIIGPTGSGRKGESFAQARKFVSSFTSFSSYFVEQCMASGLTSGEGLVAHFSDRSDEREQQDRRLVVTEKEFARTLTASKREASTLGPILRTLWEDDTAQVMTRSEPLKASGVHLVVIGHITARELRMKLSGADISGGTVNRFLPIAVKQHQLLDEETPSPELSDITSGLEDRIRLAHVAAPARFQRTEAARAYWKKVYRTLSGSEVEGPLGEVLARAPAYVLRLALLYAVIDGATEIDAVHLRAGLAVVKYAADTARDVFGDLSGNTDLDKLTAQLRNSGPAGLSRVEVSALFGRNKSADQIDALVSELATQGKANVHTVQPARGRPTQRLIWNPGQTADPITDLLTEEAAR